MKKRLALTFLCLLFLLLPLISAQQPICQQIGTEQEGWYQNEQLVVNASCVNCKALCDHTGTQQEGWYSSCDNSLIKQEICLVKCYSDANCPTKQNSYCQDSRACTETISQKCNNPGTTSSACVAVSSLSCIDCAYGCSNGICKNPEVPQLCIDSDGQDYYVKGYVKTESGDIWDSCSEAQIKEGVCMNGKYNVIAYTCPQGCSDGRCIKQETWTGLVHIEVVENICEECPASTSLEKGKAILCKCESIKLYNAKIQFFDSSGNFIASGDTAKGYVDFSGLKEGVYSAKLSADGYIPDHAEINVGPNIGNYWTISLKKAETATGNIKITVQDKTSGSILTNAKVFVYDTYGNFIASGDTSPGAAVIYNLKEGTYVAVASADGYNQNKVDFKIAGGKSDYLTISLEKQTTTTPIPTTPGIYWYRNAYWRCYDGYEEKSGGETSCKPSEVWKKYAEESCNGHCTIICNLKDEECLKQTKCPIVCNLKDEVCLKQANSCKCGVNTFKVYNECPGSVIVQPSVCGNGICESGEGEICAVEAIACEVGKKCEAKPQQAKCYYGCEQDCKKPDEKYIEARLNEKFKMQMSQGAKFQDIALEIKFNDLFIPKCIEAVEATAGGVAQPVETTPVKAAIVEKYDVTGKVISETSSSSAGGGGGAVSSSQTAPTTTSTTQVSIAKCIGAEPYAVLQIKSGQESQRTEVIKLQVGEKRKVFDFTISFMDYDAQSKTGVFLVSQESFTCPENCICDLAGKTIECKKIEKCPKKTMLCPDGTCREKCEVENITIDCNFGCFYNGKCLPYGLRINKLYCSIDDNMKSQLAEEEACENNFECLTNVCVNSKCISGGLIQKILDWFKNLFGG